MISCGLPDLSFIGSPANISVVDAAPPYIRFFHDAIANNSDTFRGYSLWYKFYDNESDSGGCRADRNNINGSPIVTNESRLMARGFHRIVLNDNEQLLALVVNNKAVASEIRIDIPDLDGPDSRDMPSTATVDELGGVTSTLHRDVEQTSDRDSRYKPLHANPMTIFSSTDDDIPDTITNIARVLSDRDLYIAFYGISIGFSFLFAPLYSEPEFLGYLSMSGAAAATSQECNSGV